MEHQPATPGSSALGQSINRLGFELFEQLHSTENLVLSPVGVHAILSLLCTGARGKTRKLLEGVVGADPTGAGVLSAFQAIEKRTRLSETLVKSLDRPREGERSEFDGTATSDDLRTHISTANSMWVQSGYDVHQSYVDTVRDAVETTVASLDFQADKAASCQAVNDWVGEATRGKITNVVGPDDIVPLLRMILINTVYFKARWESVFHVALAGEFHPSDGSSIPASMLHRAFSGLAFHDEQASLSVLLPYYHPSLAMLIVMPREAGAVVDQAEFARHWQQLEAASKTHGSCAYLTMPEFQLKGRQDLLKALAALGLGDALSSAADYSAISNETPFYPDTIRQDTFVSVDEYGTEAAAATTAVFIGEGGPPPDPVNLVIDRPFLWAIVDRPLGTVLFMGWLESPNVPPRPGAKATIEEHNMSELKRLSKGLFSGAPEETGIHITNRRVRTGLRLPIVEAIVAGEYPRGSLGKHHAHEIIETTSLIVTQRSRNEWRAGSWVLRRAAPPAAVLLNLEGLDYTWGSAIGPLFLLGVKSHIDRKAMATCVYATGKTREALEYFFKPGMIAEQVGMRLFGDRDEAIRYLRDQLAG